MDKTFNSKYSSGTGSISGSDPEWGTGKMVSKSPFGLPWYVDEPEDLKVIRRSKDPHWQFGSTPRSRKERDELGRPIAPVEKREKDTWEEFDPDVHKPSFAVDSEGVKEKDPAEPTPPKTRYTSEEDALKRILNQQGQRTTDFPIIYSPEALEFLKESSVITLSRIEDIVKPTRRIFNAAVNSEDNYDTDNPENLQDEWTDRTPEEEEKDQAESEASEEEEEENQVGKFTYDDNHSFTPAAPGVDEEPENEDNQEEGTSQDSGEEGKEDEDIVPIPTAPPRPKKFKSSTPKVITEQTAVPHNPENESFDEEDENLAPIAESGAARKLKQDKNRKKTVNVPPHAVQGPDRFIAHLLREDNEKTQKMLVRKSDKKGITYNAALDDTLNDLRETNEKRENIKELSKAILDKGLSDDGYGKAVTKERGEKETHVHCGCEKRDGFETLDNIAKIKGSDQYKQGIIDIKRDPQEYDSDGYSKRDRMDKFIAESTRCKGD